MRIYTEEEFKNMLGFSEKKIRALLKSPGFPAVKIGSSFLIEEDAAKEWFSERKEIKLDYSKI